MYNYILLFFSHDSLVLVLKKKGFTLDSVTIVVYDKKNYIYHIMFMLEDLQMQAQILALDIRLVVMVSEQVLMLSEGKQNPK